MTPGLNVGKHDPGCSWRTTLTDNFQGRCIPTAVQTVTKTSWGAIEASMVQ